MKIKYCKVIYLIRGNPIHHVGQERHYYPGEYDQMYKDIKKWRSNSPKYYVKQIAVEEKEVDSKTIEGR